MLRANVANICAPPRFTQHRHSSRATSSNWHHSINASFAASLSATPVNEAQPFHFAHRRNSVILSCNPEVGRYADVRFVKRDYLWIRYWFCSFQFRANELKASRISIFHEPFCYVSQQIIFPLISKIALSNLFYWTFSGIPIERIASKCFSLDSLPYEFFRHRDLNAQRT